MTGRRLHETETRPLTVVLIEDDDGEAKAVERAFRKSRILNRIVRAVDGVEGLALLRGETEHKIEQPLVLLVDINMPRMNGHEFLTALRADKNLKDLIAFTLTTSMDAHDIEQAYDRNVAGYLVKERAGEDFIDLVSTLESFWTVVEFPVLKQKEPRYVG
ncbi:response regulator [Sagittula salina]|uniref:Response regulator n=1 Tax=Sagittula salina TaxID=2820268 RepID=A0A940MR70_9RHOB|nr:response regulator [Sagittula salina]MBP0483502.1 response regulator [Sagittula salina]